MTVRIQSLEIELSKESPENQIKQALCTRYGLDSEEINYIRINKKSLDARRKARIVYHYQVDVDLADEDSFTQRHADTTKVDSHLSVADPTAGVDRTKLKFKSKPVIIGSGPAGIFTALTLAQAGVKSIIVDRGEPVEKRMRTVNQLRRSGTFYPESNYCFGEGGAGTFSDGKLSCGKNHPLIRFVFENFVKHGAPKDILFEGKPHIGTDFLMRIAKNMRSYLESMGCEFVFQKRLVDFSEGESNRYMLQFHDGSSLPTDYFVLAIGHSARDTYQILKDKGLAMVPKPFAMGARFEHPQDQINSIQFGKCELLPAAEYKLVTHVGDRGIWTFCMCPGGHLLPTSAQAGHLAINGMSYHGRKSGYANAAVVVNVLREDFYRGDVLDGMRYQEEFEKTAFQHGAGTYASPAQKMKDFIAGKDSRGTLNSTYKPGVVNARMDKILPHFIVDALKAAVKEYNKKMRGFISEEAIIVGLESKTSSPVSMLRAKNLQSLSHPYLYPTGEGAGYAGGIVSAALDGVRVGAALLESAQQ